MVTIFRSYISKLSDLTLTLSCISLAGISVGSWYSYCYQPLNQKWIRVFSDNRLLHKRIASLSKRLLSSRTKEYEPIIEECAELTRSFPHTIQEGVQQFVTAIEITQLNLVTWKQYAEKEQYGLTEVSLSAHIEGTFQQFVAFIEHLSPALLCRECKIVKKGTRVFYCCSLTIFSRKKA